MPGKKFFISLGIALVIGNVIDFEKKQTRWEMLLHGCELYNYSNSRDCENTMIRAEKSFYKESWISESLYWLIIIRLLASVLNNQEPTKNDDDYLDRY